MFTMRKKIQEYISNNPIFCFVCTSKTEEAKARIYNLLKDYDTDGHTSIEVLEDGSYNPWEDLPLCSDGFWPCTNSEWNDCANIDIIKVKFDNKYIDIVEFLKDNREKVGKFNVGAYWSGWMDESGSYYAEELGYDNPEEYDDPDMEQEVQEEWLNKQAVLALNKHLFVDIFFMVE